jgi:hypothetical protein
LVTWSGVSSISIKLDGVVISFLGIVRLLTVVTLDAEPCWVA